MHEIRESIAVILHNDVFVVSSVCGLENCKTCEEVPAKCTECNVDYVLDMNAMCGE